MKYVVQIVEELVKHVVVEAESTAEAEDKVVKRIMMRKLFLIIRIIMA